KRRRQRKQTTPISSAPHLPPARAPITWARPRGICRWVCSVASIADNSPVSGQAVSSNSSLALSKSNTDVGHDKNVHEATIIALHENVTMCACSVVGLPVGGLVLYPGNNMSAPSQSGGAPITDERQLVSYFEQACKPPSRWRLGTEHEKFVFDRETLRPL